MSTPDARNVRLIVGLGNVGAKYNGTRHNIGFEVIDALAEKYEASGFVAKFKGAVAAIQINGQKVLLLKPHTFMNLSGQSVLAALSFLKLKPEEVLIIHDDLDLDIGETRMKQGGGHGGHNGLRDIDAKIGKNYHRVRIGIGHPRRIKDCPIIDPSDYVLGRFSNDEKVIFKKIIDKVINDIENIVNKD